MMREEEEEVFLLLRLDDNEGGVLKGFDNNRNKILKLNCP